MRQPAWIKEELSNQEIQKHTDELRERIGIEYQRINRIQTRIRRVQEGYEADPPIYTIGKAEVNIREYRDLISQIEKEVYRLQEILA